jgi:alpha-tubulin suppressor-like RCC1 family protein
MKQTLTRFSNLKAALAVLALSASSALGTSQALAQHIAAGGYHTLYTCGNGLVQGWGGNGSGQLADASYADQASPIQVSGISGVTAIAGGDYHSLALKSNGTVWSWGANWEGQLGDGTWSDQVTPVQVSGLTNVTAIAAGYHSLALKSNGTVVGWGANTFGELGNGSQYTSNNTPVTVSGLTNVVAIAAGVYHSMALKSDGTVWTWGANWYGGLGTGGSLWTNQTTPAQVSGLSGIVAIAAGDYHSVALKNDGTVWVWGANGSGQVGDGSYNDQYVPVQVTGLTGVTAISAGSAYSMVIGSNGTVWAWGANGNGQLGDGSFTDQTAPVQVSGLTGITEISGGYYHASALKDDGTIWGWGNNWNGQLADASFTDQGTPVQASGAAAAPAVSVTSAGSVCGQNTIYIGYGPSALNLSAAATGGAPAYTYTWSASSITTPTRSVSPLATTTYTVTVKDANNCLATASIAVKVKDVRCGNKNDKVQVCHNGSVNCVAPNAVAAHLGHGDCLGECTTASNAKSLNYAGSNLQGAEASIALFPNPAHNTLNVELKDIGTGYRSYQVTDISGRVVLSKTLADEVYSDVTSVNITSLAPGIYILRIATDSGAIMQRFTVQ